MVSETNEGDCLGSRSTAAHHRCFIIGSRCCQVTGANKALQSARAAIKFHTSLVLTTQKV